MAHIEFLQNVTHNGVVIPAGAIISDIERDLKEVAQGLIDRGLAVFTEKATTHTASIVGGDQYALPHAEASKGSAPTANQQIAKDEQARQTQAGQVAGNPEVHNPTVNNAPIAPTQPTAAEVAKSVEGIK